MRKLLVVIFMLALALPAFGQLFPKQADEFAVIADLPRGPNSNIYVVDPQSGSDSNPGTSLKTPLATITAALAKCTANQNDVVLLVGGPTSNMMAAALDWNKAYTHLIGLSAPKAMGQRCRVGGSAALDLDNLITFSAAGCIVRNVQFQNGSDANAEKHAVTISGSYGWFENCQFGLTHATAVSHASSCAVVLSGSENTFKNCVIGNQTVTRAGTNTIGELSILTAARRNEFVGCEFQTCSETAGKFLVTIADDTWTTFRDCAFSNFSPNWVTTLTDAMDLPTVAGALTYNVILLGSNQLIGITGWADVATKIHTQGVYGTATYGVDTAPAT